MRILLLAAAFMNVGALAASPSTEIQPAAQSGQTPGWQGYRTILWLSGNTLKQTKDSDALLRVLRDMGVNTGMISAGGDPEPFVRAGFPFYVENAVSRGLCLKYHSKVTDWSKFIDEWAKTRGEEAFVREPSLEDPAWRAEAAGDLTRLLRKLGSNTPLALDLRDELSVTTSANPFDYDFSPAGLGAFREWLKTQYRDLPALNAEWETSFANWDDVKPFSTDRIKARMAGRPNDANGEPDWSAVKRVSFDAATALTQRPRWNFAPWCDFRTFQDISLARTLGDLRETVRKANPQLPVGIEGTQMPSAWGGYDFWRLSQVLDWVEPYDVANAREIWGSFMPGRPMLTTVGEKDVRAARRRLWHLLLQGDRGCIVWWSEDCVAVRDGVLTLSERGQALAPVLKEMTSPLAALFLRAQREFDPIAIHYSQPSIQVDWLIESTADGRTWPRRFSSFEGAHNRLAAIRNGWLKALQDLGFSPRFVSSEQIVRGELPFKALVLPNSLALSDKELDALRTSKCLLLADTQPGLFDEHGKLRAAAPELPVRIIDGAAEYGKARHLGADFHFAEEVRSATGDVAPAQVPPSGRLMIFRYALGQARLVAVERNIDYRMGEDLKQSAANTALEQAGEFRVPLGREGHVYDLRSGKYLGETGVVNARIDPWEPSLFAILPAKVEGQVVDALASPK